MKYPPSKFAKDFPTEKRKNDTLICLLLLRPISFVISSLFSALRISANFTSIISLLFSITSCVFLLIDSFFPNIIFIIISFASFFIWAILDCVDGNLARTVKKEKFGGFFDAIAGYVYPGFYLLSYGFNAIFKEDIVFGSEHKWVFLVSSLAGMAMITFMLCHKKFLESETELVKTEPHHGLAHKITLLIKRLWSEISFGGFMPLFCLIAFIFKVQTLVCLIYSLIFILFSILGMIYLILKGIFANYKK